MAARPVSFHTADSLGPVRNALDVPALERYLVGALPQLFNPPPPGRLQVQQFAHGQSNPTYLLAWGPHRVVLRKKPAGTILASAHAVDREYAVIHALHSTGSVPVPRPLLLCQDSSVIGTPFYLMHEVVGTIFLDPNLPAQTPTQRAAVYDAMARTLAALHSVDPSAAGLGAFGGGSSGGGGSAPQPGPAPAAGGGGGGGYCQRQLRRWGSQYAASVAPAAGGTGPMPEVVSLLAWLNANVPHEDALYTGSSSSSSSSSGSAASSGGGAAAAAPQQGAGGRRVSGPKGGQVICHGDFRLDNLVVTLPAGGDGGRVEVQAVLDWELSTLGNPWADVAYCCLPYHLPADFPAIRALDRPLAPGIPGEDAFLAAYCRSAGLASPPSPRDWSFYLALSLFRLTAILAGVQARARQGNASSAHAAAVSSHHVQRALAHAALRVVGLPIPPTAAAAAPAPAAAETSCVCGPCRSAAASAPSGGPGVAVVCECGSACSGPACPAAKQRGASKAAASGAGAHASGSSGSSSGSGTDGEYPPPSGVPRGLWLGRGSKATVLHARLVRFMEQYIYPAEAELEAHAMQEGPGRWSICPLMETLKKKAQQEGLWNLWLPGPLAARITPLLHQLLPADPARVALLAGPGLSNLEYAHMCEVTGHSVWAPEVFNCGAPDTGNMEVLAKYGSPAQQAAWLLPLLAGDIRSCFAMTETAVASSDATNIQARITRSPCGGFYTLSGRKWWTSGACDPRCKIAIFMGKTDPSAPPHAQQSMVLVPMDAPGVKVLRPMLVMGYDDAPHGHAEVAFDDVRVPASHLLLGEGRGFEIAQGRLGPGRLHHCMRLIGAGERAMSLMAQRALSRSVFGGPIAQQGAFQSVLAECRVDLDASRLLVLGASDALDGHGFKGARGAIAAAKVAVPRAVQRIVDSAMQVHGGAGVSQDTPLARLWAAARTLRIADGPDEVHLGSIAKLELSSARKALARAKSALGGANPVSLATEGASSGEGGSRKARL